MLATFKTFLDAAKVYDELLPPSQDFLTSNQVADIMTQVLGRKIDHGVISNHFGTTDISKSQFIEVYDKFTHPSVVGNSSAYTQKNFKNSAAGLFDLIDTNKKGYIMFGDLQRACKSVEIGLKPAEMQDMMDLVCREDEDSITRAQFIEFFMNNS